MSENAAIVVLLAERWADNPTDENARALSEAVETYRISTAVNTLILTSGWGAEGDDCERS